MPWATALQMKLDELEREFEAIVEQLAALGLSVEEIDEWLKDATFAAALHVDTGDAA